jgi:hypothetical protein
MPATAVGPGRPRALQRDVSNTIQDAKTAYGIATTILSEVETLQSLTESPIVFEYKADDPSTKYLTDISGNEIAIWRGEDIVGRMGVIPGLTPTNPNWPISLMQVKTYHVSHGNRTGTAQLGKYVDWTAEIGRYAAQDAQRPDSALHTPGASSAFAAPLDALPQNGATTVNVPTTGPSGTIGTYQVQKDLDITPPQWVYDDPTGTALPAGEYGDLSEPLNGHILSFLIRVRTGTNAAASGVFGIYQGHGTGAPTLIRTLTVSSILEHEDVLPDTGIIEITAGDYLRLKIVSTDAAHVTIRPTFRRTGGSDRPTSTAPAIIESITTTRDADTGVVTFHITADRPVRAWVLFGTEGGAYPSSTDTTRELSKTPEPTTFALPDAVTMHGKAFVITADDIGTASADFTF